MCVEQAGEGRGVWRRSEKCSHQSKGAGLQLKSDLTKSKAVISKIYLRYLPVLDAAEAARRHAQEGQVGIEASSFKPSQTVQPARQVSLPSGSSWLQCLWRRHGLDGPPRAEEVDS